MPNPHRTGGWVVLKVEALLRIVNDSDLAASILRARFTFIEDSAWSHLGLPPIGGAPSPSQSPA